MSGPLTGLRVLELPAIGPVPFLGMLLTDLGADVIQIMKPEAMRSDLDTLFVTGPLGRGRQPLELNLRAPGASEVVLRLAEHCDALIEGFRPGVAERLGIGPTETLSCNPKLVYGRLTGWGQDGPLALTAGHDITYLAISGMLHGIGSKTGPPTPAANYLADFAGGSLFLGIGLVAALLHARTTGIGQVLDAAMVEGAAYLTTMTRQLLDSGLWHEQRESNLLDGGRANYRCYECADGKWVAVGALEPQFWATLCHALGADVTEVPSPYDPAQSATAGTWLSGIFKTKPRDDWADLFAPLDACVAPVLSLTETPHHPHNVARGAFAESDGALVANPAPRFSVTPAALTFRHPGPLGTDLFGELGYEPAEIAALRDAGAIP